RRSISSIIPTQRRSTRYSVLEPSRTLGFFSRSPAQGPDECSSRSITNSELMGSRYPREMPNVIQVADQVVSSKDHRVIIPIEWNLADIDGIVSRRKTRKVHLDRKSRGPIDQLGVGACG